jgi:tetratricopeptide (TPR) repeat protein
MKHTINFRPVYAMLFCFCICCSCKKYLDEKSNKKLVVPATIQDAQAIVDTYGLLSSFYPSLGVQSDDDFYLLDTYWSTLTTVTQNNYIWAKENFNEFEWGYLYQMVLYANVAKETVEKITPDAGNIADLKRIRGAALFFRAFAFYHLAQCYAIQYDKAIAAQTLGIPLRLSGNVGDATIRSSLEQTYEQMISDLTEALTLLPVVTSPVSRPSKAAAYGALAKIYLSMEDYTMAGKYADSCLQLNNQLMDYNSINAAASFPFARFNTEVVFPAILIAPALIDVTNWKADSVLYQSYANNDLRKSVFYQSNGPGTFGFKGSYDGSVRRFCGIATDEVYLIRAECKARAGNKDDALNDLNTLLVKRWKTGTFIPFTAPSADDALAKILDERRKELVLRGTRWMDLRRLNRDTRFAKTLMRKLYGITYLLPPNDNRYTFYIPQSVIDISGIQQNQR